MIKISDIPLGVRVSNKLKKSLDHYCKKHGISRKHFVEDAIYAKLIEIMEDEKDLAVAKDRVKNDAIIDEKAVEAYFTKRLKEK